MSAYRKGTVVEIGPDRIFATVLTEHHGERVRVSSEAARSLRLFLNESIECEVFIASDGELTARKVRRVGRTPVPSLRARLAAQRTGK